MNKPELIEAIKGYKAARVAEHEAHMTALDRLLRMSDGSGTLEDVARVTEDQMKTAMREAETAIAKAKMLNASIKAAAEDVLTSAQKSLFEVLKEASVGDA